MAYEKYYKNNHSGGNSVEIATPFVKVMRNVYAWMALGLLMTALTAVLVASTPPVIYTLASSPMLIFALFALELGMVIWMSARIHKRAATTAGVLFALYAVLNGVTMSFIFLAYAMESIATTFLITAGTFGAMTLVGYTTKKDLSALGRTLMMLLIGLIIATLVNLFVASSGLAVILNYVFRGDAEGTYAESHFAWQIRTFWLAALFLLLILLCGTILMFVGIGILVFWIGFLVLGIWVAYRIIYGWLRLSRHEALPL